MSNLVHERIAKRLKELNKTPQEVSLEAGLSRDYLRTLFNREHSQPKGENAAKLAKALQVTVQWLLTGSSEKESNSRQQTADLTTEFGDDIPTPSSMRRELPVYGLVAGSIAGAHALSKDPMEYVIAPIGLLRVKDAYALRVTGESMIPRYFPDDIIFMHPGRPVRQGDHVVVQEERDGETIASIKCFVRKTDGHIVTRQYNEPAEVKFNLRYVAAVHRVMTPNELLGV